MNMKMRRAGLLTVFFLTAGTLNGCSREEVDYRVGTEKESQDVSNKLTQFADEGQWVDEWDISTEDGDFFSLGVDAEIIVPDADTMSVLEVEEIPIDADFKQRLVQTFFGGSQVYYHDPEYLLKEELQQMIEELEPQVAEYEELVEHFRNRAEEEGDPEVYQSSIESCQELLDGYRSKLNYYNELLASAPDHYVEAEDYDSCNEFLSYLNEVPYIVTIKNRNSTDDYIDGTVEVTVEPADMDELAPEEIRERKDYMSFTSMEMEPENNQCKYTMEEARAMAERFIEQIGLSHQICTISEQMIWKGLADSEHEEIIVTNGYVFNFYTGVEEKVPLIGFGNSYKYPMADMQDTADESDDRYTMDDQVIVQVFDEGVMRVVISDPISVTEVTSGVKLLPLSSVQSVMEQELKEHSERYILDERSVNNVMELNYLRVTNENKEHTYSYLPVWMLCHRDSTGVNYHPVFINAIDGSVIYLEDI